MRKIWTECVAQPGFEQPKRTRYESGRTQHMPCVHPQPQSTATPANPSRKRQIGISVPFLCFALRMAVPQLTAPNGIIILDNPAVNHLLTLKL
jgi:hypothetical protein